MSAVNPNFDERDFEALRRAQRAHEPAMQEIFASIRTLLSFEPAAAQVRSPSPYERPYASEIRPQVGAPEHAPAGWPIDAEPTERLKAGQALDAHAPKPPTTRRTEPGNSYAAVASRGDGRRFLPPEADWAGTASFWVLSVARHVDLQRLMHEMLRPLLKEWLDENLPRAVERLVRAEIERAAHGLR